LALREKEKGERITLGGTEGEKRMSEIIYPTIKIIND
jgi:hypothetical protein